MANNEEVMKMIDRLKAMFPDKTDSIEALEADLEGESKDEEASEPKDETPSEDLGEMDDMADLPPEDDSEDVAPEDKKNMKKKPSAPNFY